MIIPHPMSNNVPPEQRAIAHVANRATGEPIDRSLRVTVHFHPDRLYRDEPILAAIARDGHWRSQFETGTSNGSLSAFHGGDRWNWESRIFGGAYDDTPSSSRPKYGALSFRSRPTAGSPRFGSAFLRLAEQTLDRTTFCFPDSVFEPKHFGVASRMSLTSVAQAADCDLLDDYIEAQIHGPLQLAKDVEAIVLDPCYQGTEIERLASHLPFPIEWHLGFRLSVDVLQSHPQYRGQEYVDLGCALARDGWLTPKLIGDAARTNQYDDQSLKRVWHYLARFGTPY
jgi:hypothetical protein